MRLFKERLQLSNTTMQEAMIFSRLRAGAAALAQSSSLLRITVSRQVAAQTSLSASLATVLADRMAAEGFLPREGLLELFTKVRFLR